MDRRLAAITGGAGGIGREIAFSLACSGFDVALLGRDPRTLQDVAREVAAAGVQAYAVRADVRREDEVRSAFGGLARPLDVLVVNAGVGHWASVEETELADWQRVMETNLQGAFLCSRAALPGLRRTGGRIIFVSSGAAKRGRAKWSAYSAAKAGLAAFSESLAEEVRADGIAVHVVTPGAVDTPFWRDAGTPKDVLQPAHVAEAVRFLACLPASVAVPELRIRPAAAPR